MGELKPLGSEKLGANEKLNRILELTYFNEKKTNNNNGIKAELVKESTNGVYGIVKEKDGYYVKKGLNESTLDYIGGMFMKNKNKFNSYSEALKRMDLLSGQELNEDATKYVLKQNKPKGEAAPVAPELDSMPAPAPAAPEATAADSELPSDESLPSADSEPISTDDELSSDSEEDGKRSTYMAEVQKYSGKLGQELRDQQNRMESDDIKYVLNMIISAVDLDKLDFDDIEEIAKKFERDEEEGNEMPADDEELPTDDETPEEVAPEDDLAERMSKLEELINSKFGEDEETELNEYGQEHDSEKPAFDSFIDDENEEEIDEFFFYDDEDFERRDKGLKPLSRDRNNEKIRYDGDDEDYEEEIDITPELDSINESIKTTLSKYFE
jgi:hypothetical protein